MGKGAQHGFAKHTTATVTSTASGSLGESTQ